jgi:8-oxo-dGTP pyrophosphatase MutT (NUDIX family)
MSRRDYFNDPDAPTANSMVPAVTAIIRDEDDRLLLIHRTDNDRWSLPGGGVELGESVTEAVIREVQEETGISVEVLDIVGVYSDPRHVIAFDDGEVRQQFSICFAARPAGGTLHASAESKEVRWVDPDQLDTLEIHPSMRIRIGHGLDPERASPYIG